MGRHSPRTRHAPSDDPSETADGREEPTPEPGVHRDYVLDVRIVETDPAEATVGGDATDRGRYRFEAPNHDGRTFDDPETAEVYAAVYFDANGFVEAGTGDRGVPPEVVQAGRDTLAAYLLTQPYADRHWVASFYGKAPEYVERYVESVRHRAREVRRGVRERDDEAIRDAEP
ncbi:hypothetical protein [Halorubellus sp. PRR65]|uniref:hypothetical protein n=1 Tax=Halorubellus sp. PRR65 TaxID=3098148 RepID=UPI002B25D372|nr:hypothetical protein [Halorubellus sp. PRR65]